MHDALIGYLRKSVTPDEYTRLDRTEPGWGNWMATALDVAAFILNKRGPMTAMKLQKLVYYSKAWHLVWEDKLLFTEPIEAWANGPVVPELYKLIKDGNCISTFLESYSKPQFMIPADRPEWL